MRFFFNSMARCMRAATHMASHKFPSRFFSPHDQARPAHLRTFTVCESACLPNTTTSQRIARRNHVRTARSLGRPPRRHPIAYHHRARPRHAHPRGRRPHRTARTPPARLPRTVILLAQAYCSFGPRGVPRRRAGSTWERPHYAARRGHRSQCHSTLRRRPAPLPRPEPRSRRRCARIRSGASHRCVCRRTRLRLTSRSRMRNRPPGPLQSLRADERPLPRTARTPLPSREVHYRHLHLLASEQRKFVARVPVRQAAVPVQTTLEARACELADVDVELLVAQPPRRLLRDLRAARRVRGGDLGHRRVHRRAKPSGLAGIGLGSGLEFPAQSALLT